MKSFLTLSVRVAILSVILLIARIIAAVLAGIDTSVADDASNANGRETEILLILFCVSFLECIAWVYPIRKSNWFGWRLAIVVFVVTFGVMTLQPQIEAIYFDVLEIEVSLRAMQMGIVTSLLFAPASVWILGRWRADTADSLEVEPRPGIAMREWIAKLAASGILYVILYMFFGHFVAWQSAEIRSFYDGPATGGGLENFGPVAMPLFGPFQFLRGLLWTGLGLLVLKLMMTDWWKAGLALGVLLALIMNAQLLIPNPYMPAKVRFVHLIETVPSNFLFGVGIAWIFRRLIPTNAADVDRAIGNVAGA